MRNYGKHPEDVRNKSEDMMKKLIITVTARFTITRIDVLFIGACQLLSPNTLILSSFYMVKLTIL